MYTFYFIIFRVPTGCLEATLIYGNNQIRINNWSKLNYTRTNKIKYNNDNSYGILLLCNVINIGSLLQQNNPKTRNR